MEREHRFTYGDQFSPDKFALIDLLDLCGELEPSRYALQTAIRQNYFEGHGRDPNQRDENSTRMAMNCLLSLNAYGLIQLREKGATYSITTLAHDLLARRDDNRAVFAHFARYILIEREGLLLTRLVETIRARGEQVSLEYIGEELNDLGITIPPNSTYVSTMRQWLAQAGVFRATGYEVNWDVIYDLLNVDADTIGNLYQLTIEQKHYMLSLADLNAVDFVDSSKVREHTRSIYKIRVTTKNLVKNVLEPLQATGLIETRKITSGRGAKPHEVRLSALGQNEFLAPLIANLARTTELTTADLNQPFERVVAALNHSDKHTRGIALELLAIWIVRLLGLRFSSWRLRHWQATGGGEVDVLAASDKVTYSRWQIQCKNTRQAVGVEAIAKEVGMTFVTKADVIMLITTGRFASDAVNYANVMNDVSRYYVILLEGDDIERIVTAPAKIVEILNIKARRAFARRELGMSDFGVDLEWQPPLTEEALERAIEEEAEPEADD